MYTGELPPRARRIQFQMKTMTIFPGTTSACAENTLAYRTARTLIGNYLRVRGEYAHRRTTATFAEELPPRARRIRFESVADFVHQGTTSACAENTNCTTCRAHTHRELPPRARRIRDACQAVALLIGTTSACAENTHLIPNLQIIRVNYLRVRGEYGLWGCIIGVVRELPPRARRIP